LLPKQRLRLVPCPLEVSVPLGQLVQLVLLDHSLDIFVYQADTDGDSVLRLGCVLLRVELPVFLAALNGERFVFRSFSHLDLLSRLVHGPRWLAAQVLFELQTLGVELSEDLLLAPPDCFLFGQSNQVGCTGVPLPVVARREVLDQLALALL